MKLHQLRALVMIADCGSIRAAARQLGVSQTAVAKALRELEDDLNLPLLVRNASGVVLTHYGQSLLQHARQMLSQLERAQLELAHLSDQAEGQLRLGISPWMGMTLLPEVVTLFRQRMPRVRLEIFEGLMAVTLPRLRDGTMEFAVGLVSSLLPRPEFVSEQIFSYGMAVVARHGHPLRDSRSIHDLLEQDWVVNYPDSNHESVMNELFWQHGAQIDMQHIHRAHSPQLSLSLVEQTDMLSYFPEPMLTIPGYRERVGRLALEETFATDTIGIVTRRNAQLGVAGQCFVDCLFQVIRRRARSAKAEDAALFDTLELLI
ncbi:LysR family transcriptional regulator [Pseudomonas vancouverensis]|uniref:LysR family transcriptional regulator n=1 Tax=Pseudomonas vancouverensis TaxID=95300 RepID=A0A1H2N3Z6_PSEVA|nr:LysR substrate-binding domain-containing protein [Pseudomonas vancouverensis]KAB0495836.1 LysR family transcriptional regulator [Pseudomonas vancouverensis]TDB65638.1 LysR family transcriptional regulator [Pseudomonas vancouverensis]SDV00064.1 ModE molybdate transport repressor domain-containing protein [Pseudomonas vancouverensis]